MKGGISLRRKISAFVRYLSYFLSVASIRRKLLKTTHSVHRGEEGQPQQFLVRATFSSFSRPSHIEFIVLRLLCVFKFLILEDEAIF